ncbi:site-specific integrase, partial [Alkalibacillus flavidus]
MSKSSIVRQVKTAVESVDRIGQSKRDARMKNERHFIHSKKQKRETLSAGQNFAKWARETHGVKNLHELNESHYKAYIEFKQQQGVSDGHLKNIETGLKHIEHGMQLKAKQFGKEATQFTPDKRMITSAPTTRNRAYTHEQYEKIREQLSPNSQAGVDLMRNMGLRVNEAVNVRAEHFQKTEKGWRLNIQNGQGITKGGRYRYADVPKDFENRLESILSDKNPNDRLVPIQKDTLRESVQNGALKAGINPNGKGTHGFRHLYARERVDQLFQERG